VLYRVGSLKEETLDQVIDILVEIIRD